MFVAIGYDPRTHLVHNVLDITEHGTVWVDGRTSKTSVAGVFAATGQRVRRLPIAGQALKKA